MNNIIKANFNGNSPEDYKKIAGPGYKLVPNVANAPVTKDFEALQWGPPMRSSAAFVQGYNNTGEMVSEYTSLNSSTVYSCVSKIGSAIASLPVEITGPNFQKLKNHRVAKLLRNPNPIMNRIEFINKILTALLLNGNSIIYIKRNRAGEAIQLIPIHPQNASWSWNQADDGGSGMPFYSIYHPLCGTKTFVPLRNIIHLKNAVQVGWGYDGVSPIAASQNTIGINLAQNHVVANFYSKSTISTGIVTVDDDTSPDSIASVASRFRERNTGNDVANEVLVIPKGVTFEPITMPMKDAQLLESRQFSVTEIARIFNVPLSKLAYGDAKEVSNYEQDDLSFRIDCLFPLCSTMEEAFEDKLLFDTEKGEITIEFNFDETKRTDAATRATVQQSYISYGVLNRNEVRAQEGLGPVEGGDVYLVPANLIPANDIGKSSNPPASDTDSSGKPMKPSTTVSHTGGTNNDNQEI